MDRSVIYARLVKREAAIAISSIVEFVLNVLTHVAKSVVLVFITEAIRFVHKDLEIDSWVVVHQPQCRADQLVDAVNVLVLNIDDPYNGASRTEDRFMIVAGRHEWQHRRYFNTF